jgi:hypothetical protein
MIKNKIYSSGQVIVIAVGETYTLKSDEVMINNSIYKKVDLEITLQQNYETSDSKTVGVAIKKRTGRINLPTVAIKYQEWEVDGVAQISLGGCVENIATVLESLSEEITAFTIEVKSDNSGTSGTNQFTIPTTTGTYLYDYTTSDGQSGTGITGDETITFASGAGTYWIYITGTFPRIYFANGGDKLKLLRVLDLGIYGVGETDQNFAFRGCSNLTSISGDASNLNLMTDGLAMFLGCTNLASLPSGMTLASLTNGTSMFYQCTNLVLPTGMTLSSLTNGTSMFRQCISIASLPSGMTLNSLTLGTTMFYQCTSLISLPSGMTLASLETGINMFRDCTNLVSLPSGMTLASLTMGYYMFYMSTSITDLPTGITLSSLTTGTNMFDGITINTTRYSQLLVDMEDLNPNNSVGFHGGNSLYNSTGETARNILTGGTRSWTISDGGLAP